MCICVCCKHRQKTQEAQNPVDKLGGGADHVSSYQNSQISNSLSIPILGFIMSAARQREREVGWKEQGREGDGQKQSTVSSLSCFTPCNCTSVRGIVPVIWVHLFFSVGWLHLILESPPPQPPSRLICLTWKLSVEFNAPWSPEEAQRAPTGTEAFLGNSREPLTEDDLIMVHT